MAWAAARCHSALSVCARFSRDWLQSASRWMSAWRCACWASAAVACNAASRASERCSKALLADCRRCSICWAAWASAALVAWCCSAVCAPAVCHSPLIVWAIWRMDWVQSASRCASADRCAAWASATVACSVVTSASACCAKAWVVACNCRSICCAVRSKAWPTSCCWVRVWVPARCHSAARLRAMSCMVCSQPCSRRWSTSAWAACCCAAAACRESTRDFERSSKACVSVCNAPSNWVASAPCVLVCWSSAWAQVSATLRAVPSHCALRFCSC